MEGFDSVDRKIDNKQLISLYLKVTEKFPNDSKALEILGVLYNVAGDRQAASSFKQSMSFHQIIVPYGINWVQHLLILAT